MPKLWDQSVQTHRRAVEDAILDATASLVAQQGLASVTMSGIASQAGIGRATLYKYFSDVDAILLAWHERHVGAHLEHLVAISAQGGSPAERLEAVMTAYAQIVQQRHHDGIATMLHRGDHMPEAAQQLRRLLTELLDEAVAHDVARGDVPTAQLALYCEHALGAASDLDPHDAVAGLVQVTLAGLRPQR